METEQSTGAYEPHHTLSRKGGWFRVYRLTAFQLGWSMVLKEVGLSSRIGIPSYGFAPRRLFVKEG